MSETLQAFNRYENCLPAGVFTCSCPGDEIVSLSKILKTKGAEAIHFCTCAFAKKTNDGWVVGDGFCDHLDEIIEKVNSETGITCVKGTAHLPKNYTPQIWEAKEA